MENKYYDLIVTLVKNHRKYEGCEELLEDIVNDVLEHSKVVIESVTNEDVIVSYITKVVNTSIITIPKKYNLKTRKTSFPVHTIKKTEIEPTLLEKEDVLETINDESVIFEEIIDTQEEILIKEEEVDIVLETDTEIEDEEINIENTSPETSLQEEVLDIEERVETSAIDKSLIDKMINGISTDAEIENISNEEELHTLNEIDELEISEEEEEEEEEENQENILNLNIETLTVSEENEDNEIISIEELPDIEEDLKIQEYTEDFQEPEELEPETLIDLDTPIEAFDIEELSDTVSLDEEYSEEEEEETLLSEELQEEVKDESDIIDETVTEISEQNEDYYSLFAYEPPLIEVDADEILNYLEDIDSKHPERQILKICDLKYTQKLSVTQIAELLNISEDSVLDVLTEIIEIVKD